jgi:WD40 repeat protein
MARLRRHSARALSLAAALAAAPAWAQPVPPGFHDRPVLVVDPGRHAAPIKRADVDDAGRFVVTASDDKTVRVWSGETGALERSIRLPAGPGHVGKAYAAVISPDGALIAVGGFTAPSAPYRVLLYARDTGALVDVIPGLPNVVNHLAFSRDGRFLAATLHSSHGLRVFDRDKAWALAARDGSYGDQSHGAAFASDGRLATTSYDGRLRLYGPGPSFERLAEWPAPGGARLYDIAFSPDGARLAVGYSDATRVDVVDGHTLAPLHAAQTGGLDNGSLLTVAWAADGTLLAAGRYVDQSGGFPVMVWPEAGRGARRALRAGADTVMSLRPLVGGDIVVAASDPWLGRLGADGAVHWVVPSPLANYRGQRGTLRVSDDGAVVEFVFEQLGRVPARFDVGRLALTDGPTASGTAPPRQEGLPVQAWVNSRAPRLDGRALLLGDREIARSLAIHPDGARFVLGADWSLRAFSAAGEPLWRSDTPGTVWALNISGDGRLVVAAYGDGTIRWHRMDDGREILAFMPMADRTNWVAWTPEGFYAASPGAHGVLRWHVNHPGFRTSAHAVADIPGFHRPAVIPLVLQEMETARAIGIATMAEQRRKVQLLTNSAVPPGARLHLLAIGVSRYNARHAANLRLEFAHKDASDVANALGSTQDGLYVTGTRQYLVDEDATRASIRRALAAMQAAMGKDDLAVIHFSGHGAMVDGALYLLPHDVDARDAVAVKDSALPVAALREELLRLAERGRVLVLLDACYSGGAARDGGARTAASAQLTQALAAANVTVLTSSSDSETSREDAAWGNGAFTKAVLEALGRDADENRDGLLSATELAGYVERRVRALTGGRQNPAMELRFGGSLFAVQ